ncbi:MAG: DUF502 domain-containing protein [Phycisphaeraceae bacterium]
MDGPTKKPPSNFRKFFVRGLAILLPSVLTIWLLLAAYQFVQGRIAGPINQGVRELVLRATPWPRPEEDELNDRLGSLRTQRVETRRWQEWLAQEPAYDTAADVPLEEIIPPRERRALVMELRREQLETWWQSYFMVMDLIGLVVAIVLIYMAGVVLGSYIGRRLYHRGEELLNRLPLIGRVYPAVKQVTDFVVGHEREVVSFNRVVAVQYPRMGLWSVGLVTGDTMRGIRDAAGTDCMTVFIPSSPTPFTGYVITVPKDEVIELPITVEDAMKFAISGGVLVPANQKIPAADGAAPPSSGAAGPKPPTAIADTTTKPGRDAGPDGGGQS